MLKKIFIILIVFSILIPTFPSIYADASTKAWYIRNDAVVRKSPDINSQVLSVAVKNSRVKFIREEKRGNPQVSYTRIQVLHNHKHNRNRNNKVVYNNKNKTIYTGWVLSSQLISRTEKTAPKIDRLNRRLLSVLNQTALVKAAEKIRSEQGPEIRYSTLAKFRWSGFHDIKTNNEVAANNYYYYDCSSYIASVFEKANIAVLMRSNASKVNPTDRGESSGWIKHGNSFYFLPWKTFDFINDLHPRKAEPSFKEIYGMGSGTLRNTKSITRNMLLAGDVILGEDVRTANHILLYMGDGYVSHVSLADRFRKEPLFNSNGTLNRRGQFYLRLGSSNRFRNSIRVLRYTQIKNNR